ncbi:hypothetical protein TK5_09290 [Sideroxyarcus sp. TK5]
MAFCTSAARLLLGLSLLMSCHARAENQAIVFQSTETPPFWSASLPENGLGGALLRVVSAAAGVNYSIEYLPVKRFRLSGATFIVGDPDILINQKQRAIFPIGIFHSAFFYYKPHHEVIAFRRLSDLQGHTLGVLRGTLEDKEYFSSNGVRVEESDSVESLIRKLKRGRIDFCILVDAAGQHTIRKLFPNEQDAFIQVPIPGSVRPITIMIDVGAPEGISVAQRYRRVLDKTLRSREYLDVLEGFYGQNNIPADRLEHLKRFERQYSSSWDN